jgi:hypothetical protein
MTEDPAVRFLGAIEVDPAIMALRSLPGRGRK